MKKGKYNSASEAELADLLNDIKTSDNSTNGEQTDAVQINSEENSNLVNEQQDVPSTDIDISTAEVVVTEGTSEESKKKVLDTEKTKQSDYNVDTIETTEEIGNGQADEVVVNNQVTEEGTSEKNPKKDVDTEEVIQSECQSTAVELANQIDIEKLEESTSEGQETEVPLDEKEDSIPIYQFIKVQNKKGKKDVNNNEVVDLLINRKSQCTHNKLSKEDVISLIEIVQEFLYTENKEKRKYKSDTFKFSINLKEHNGTCDFCNKEESTFVIIGINDKNAPWFCEDCAKNFVYKAVKFVSRNLGKKVLIPIKQYFELNNIQYGNLWTYLQKIPTADISKKQDNISQESTILKSKTADISRDKETQYQNRIMNLEWKLTCANNELQVYKRDNEILREKLQEQEGILFKIKQTLDIGKNKTKYIISFLKDILAFLK